MKAVQRDSRSGTDGRLSPRGSQVNPHLLTSKDGPTARPIRTQAGRRALDDHRPSQENQLGLTLVVVAAALLTTFLLVAGSLGSAVVVAAATGLIIWSVRHHSAGTDRQPVEFANDDPLAVDLERRGAHTDPTAREHRRTR